MSIDLAAPHRLRGTCPVWARLFVGEDEPAQVLDLFRRRRGTGPGPLGELGSGGEALGVGEQPGQVGAQLRLVGGVGAEVLAAQAAMPERAGLPAGCNVGGLGADPERDRDLADLLAQGLGGKQGTAVGPDPLGVGADLERAEGVLGGSLAPGGDPVYPSVVRTVSWPRSSFRVSTGVPASAWRWAKVCRKA